MRVAAAVLVTVVVAALVLAMTRSASAGRTAPPLPSRALAGAPPTLRTVRGEPVLVEFFASWCGPCIAEARKVESAARALRGHAEVIGIDWSDDRGYGLRFVRRFGWSFPVLADPNGNAGYAYGIQGLPTAFVLDRHGRIVTRLVGPQTLSSLMQAVQQADTDHRD